VLAQRGAQALRFLAPGVGKVALRAAIVQLESGRVADARRRDAVPNQHDLPALFQQRPQRVVRARMRRQKQQDKRKDTQHARQHTGLSA